MTGAIVIHCACGSRAQAVSIADALVERRLAACVQLSPVESVYRWQDELRHEAEVLLSAKTLVAHFDAAAACIRALHDYDVPEIVAVPIVAIDAEYLAWIEDEVGAGQKG